MTLKKINKGLWVIILVIISLYVLCNLNAEELYSTGKLNLFANNPYFLGEVKVDKSYMIDSDFKDFRITCKRMKLIDAEDNTEEIIEKMEIREAENYEEYTELLEEMNNFKNEENRKQYKMMLVDNIKKNIQFNLKNKVYGVDEDEIIFNDHSEKRIPRRISNFLLMIADNRKDQIKEQVGQLREKILSVLQQEQEFEQATKELAELVTKEIVKIIEKKVKQEFDKASKELAQHKIEIEKRKKGKTRDLIKTYLTIWLVEDAFKNKEYVINKYNENYCTLYPMCFISWTKLSETEKYYNLIQDLNDVSEISQILAEYRYDEKERLKAILEYKNSKKKKDNKNRK